ncbi:MAG: rRNA maturation RNase YbeY [bacterium]|nr:rRNA maturation RNase YbeY [bacterium]
MKPDNVTIDVSWDGDLDQDILWSAIEVFMRRCDIPKQAAIDILFADDRILAELNAEYREIKGPTDVLAFEIGKDETDRDDYWILGQVVVSCERALEQAAEYGIPFMEEITRLMLHGLLHLVGYGHSTEDERSEMERLGDEIVSEAFKGEGL